jgi:acid phosphatase family membrane protein YuiD
MSEYKLIIIPFLTLIIGQLFKFIVESVRSKKLLWDRLFNGNGGMPSSHTSFSFSLVACVLVKEGLTSTLFPVTLIFSMIIAYDAMGVRMEAGKQAKIINKITKDMKDNKYPNLKEKLGHTEVEVVVGVIYGFLFGLLLMNIL